MVTLAFVAMIVQARLLPCPALPPHPWLLHVACVVPNIAPAGLCVCHTTAGQTDCSIRADGQLGILGCPSGAVPLLAGTLVTVQ